MWTADAAVAAYELSLLRAAEARQFATAAYTRAASAHRVAAEGAESRGDRDGAQRHRDLAAADDLSAAALAQPTT